MQKQGTLWDLSGARLPPAATSEEGSGKEHCPGDPRAKPERPDLGGYDLSVYFSRNRSCEGHRAKAVSGCSSLQPVSGHTPLCKGHLMSEMGTWGPQQMPCFLEGLWWEPNVPSSKPLVVFHFAFHVGNSQISCSKPRLGAVRTQDLGRFLWWCSAQHCVPTQRPDQNKGLSKHIMAVSSVGNTLLESEEGMESSRIHTSAAVQAGRNCYHLGRLSELCVFLVWDCWSIFRHTCMALLTSDRSGHELPSHLTCHVDGASQLWQTYSWFFQVGLWLTIDCASRLIPKSLTYCWRNCGSPTKSIHKWNEALLLFTKGHEDWLWELC